MLQECCVKNLVAAKPLFKQSGSRVGRVGELTATVGGLSRRSRRRVRDVRSLVVMAGAARRGGHCDEQQDGYHYRSEHDPSLLSVTFEQRPYRRRCAAKDWHRDGFCRASHRVCIRDNQPR